MALPNIFKKSIFTNARLKADLIEQQQWNSELASYVQDLEAKYMDLLAEDQQLGLDAQVRVHELERDLEIAKQVAEYWKASAEAQQILTSIYKTLSSL